MMAISTLVTRGLLHHFLVLLIYTLFVNSLTNFNNSFDPVLPRNISHANNAVKCLNNTEESCKGNHCYVTNR